MKTYLSIWFSTEGKKTSEITEILMSMGFKPTTGSHDYVYDWGKNATIEDAISLGDKVHATLAGSNTWFKIETV